VTQFQLHNSGREYLTGITKSKLTFWLRKAKSKKTANQLFTNKKEFLSAKLFFSS